MDSRSENVIRDFLKSVKQKKPIVAKQEPEDSMSFDDFIGQDSILSDIKIAIAASLETDTALDHMLLYGPPGLGKTQLAKLISHETKTDFIHCSPESFKNGSAVKSALAKIDMADRRSILFIDEIHRIKPSVQEMFYEVLEYFTIHGRPIRRFTTIGATTHLGMLRKPMRERFQYRLRLTPYTSEDLVLIVQLHYPKVGHDVASYISERSRGTPRVALNYTKQVVNASIYDKASYPRMDHAIYCMENSGIDHLGLEPDDRIILRALSEANAAIGFRTLCAVTNINETEMSEVREEYLLRLGFMRITPRGRKITMKGLKYLKQHIMLGD